MNVRRVREQIVDATQQAACLSGWTQEYLQLSQGVYAGAFNALELPGIVVYREDCNSALHQFGVSDQGRYHFGIQFLFNRTGGNFAGQAVGSAHLLYVKPGAEFDYFSPPDQRFFGFSIDSSLVENMLIHYHLARVPNFVIPLFHEQQMALMKILKSLLESPSEELAIEHPTAQRFLIHSVLDLVMSASPVPIARASGKRTQCDLVKKTRCYVLGHKDQPLTVLDLCDALHVSRRTLQYAFQSVLGINPVRYLRAIRLNGVRQALLSPQNPNVQVQSVASMWGMWHLSHLSEDYKAMFGESPSATLRRGLKEVWQV